MRGASFAVGVLLGALIPAVLPATAALAASTTYAAETSNNTSTCVLGSSPSPADCVATFAGQTDNRSGIKTPQFDPPGANVSADNVRDLLYGGSTTKVFVNMMLGFCTPADSSSSPTVPRCNSNVLTQYTANDTLTVDKHLRDLNRRGIDGMVMTWYGPGSRINDATLKYQSEIGSLGLCPLGPQRCREMYLVMYDGSTLKFPVTATGIPGTSGNACDPGLARQDAETCVLGRLKNDICYLNGYHFGNDAYQKFNGRPMVQFFVNEGAYGNLPKTGAAPSWADVWFWVRQWTNDLKVSCTGGASSSKPYNVDNGVPLLLFEDANGFSHAQSDGAFGWVQPTGNQDDLRISPATTNGTVQHFYSTAVNQAGKVAWGIGYKGFNDSQSAWGENRLIDQRCGQTWLQSLGAAANFYSMSNQLPFLQVATWNDYNEGSSIEDGIANCYTVSANISGSTLNWRPTPGNPNASQSTISRWLVFDSTDGGTSYQQVASLPASAISYDLSAFPAGTHKVFVKMVGKADIVNRSSAQLTFSH
jgi:hypothetical protein